MKISFKVLNFGDKIPNDSSIILITKEEFASLYAKGRVPKKANFLCYDTASGNFSKYIFEIIKEIRISGTTISEIIFSIDPGEKLGFVVFIQGFYLYSRTYFKQSELIEEILKCLDYLEGKDRNQLNIQIKVGRSANKITRVILSNLFNVFEGRKNITILLVNEENTSKLKLHKKIGEISKHEASALIIALRNGKKVFKNNYNTLMSQIPRTQFHKSSSNKDKEDPANKKERKENLKNIFVKLIQGEISIKEALNLYEFKGIII